MIKKYQVTLFCGTGAYKPVSCIVNYPQTSNENLLSNDSEKKNIQKAGVIKICQKRYWQKSDLIKYGFTKCKIREYEN